MHKGCFQIEFEVDTYTEEYIEFLKDVFRISKYYEILGEKDDAMLIDCKTDIAAENIRWLDKIFDSGIIATEVHD